MKLLIKSLALLLALLLCGLLAACGKSEDGTYSKSLGKAPVKGENTENGIIQLPAESFNELSAVELTGLTLVVRGPVSAGAEKVSFRLVNGGGAAFNFGYEDLLLQKKTESGWETYRRIDAVPEIGLSLQAGGMLIESVRPDQYGVALQAGATYRITFANAPEAYGEFTVQ